MSEKTKTAAAHDSNAIVVYRPHMRHELGLFRTWAVMARNIWGARELIWVLFTRDFTVGYKKSFVGYGWIFISPLMGIISWVFLQKTGLLQPGDVGIPYPAYVLISTSMWGLFMGFYGCAASTLSAGSGLMMQINYPHEALLFKQLAGHLANFLITFAMNLAFLLVFRVVPSWGVLLLPVVALPLFFLGTAMGLMVSMIGIVAMDLNRVFGVIMSLMMWATPLIYSDKVPNKLLQVAMKWNPVAYLVCSCREMVLYGHLYKPTGYFIAAGISLALFLLSWRMFYVSEDKLVERMV